MQANLIGEGASYKQLAVDLAALVLLFLVLGLFPVRSPGLASNVWENNAEVGFASVSPRGAGFIVPASCESGFEHLAGECAPPPTTSGTGGAGGTGSTGAGGFGSGACLANYACSGSAVFYTNSACTTTLYQQCQYGCSGGYCLPPPPPQFNSFSATNPAVAGAGPGNPTGAFTATGHLQVKPLLVQNGSPTWVYWNMSNVSSCSVSGTNGDSWTGISSGSAGKTTSPIVGQTTYTLSCAALPGATPASITETQVVNVVPSFQEK